MKQNIINARFMLVTAGMLLAVAAATLPAQAPRRRQTAGTQTAEAGRLIAVLRSNAATFDKARACQQLAVLGSKEAVPALAELLGDEKLAAYARCGLESIADPSADDALRAALGRLHGKLLAGVVNSIGVRRDAKAVGAVGRDRWPMPSSGAAAEALAALGRIATPEAIEILKAGAQGRIGRGPGGRRRRDAWSAPSGNWPSAIGTRRSRFTRPCERPTCPSRPAGGHARGDPYPAAGPCWPSSSSRTTAPCSPWRSAQAGCCRAET